MRPELLIALLLIAAAPAQARLTILVRSSVRDACRTVDTACTNFDDTELTCACILKGNVWKPAAKIVSNPVMFLSHDRYRLHELSHVYDFARALRLFKRAIEANSFDHFEDCQRFAGNAEMTFPEFMREVQRQSMRLRDHTVILTASRWPDRPRR
jgi:hypothetical protein